MGKGSGIMLKKKDCKVFMKICVKCGKLKMNFKFPKIRKSYFNRENTCNSCRNSKKEKKYEKVCPCCKQTFKTHRKDKIYCTEECYHKYRIMNRIVCYCDYCGEELHLTKKDYERSKKHFCNKTCSGKYHEGVNNPSYNLELEEEDRRVKRRIFGYKKFREEVLKRDNYTCQISGEKNCELEVHHLDGYDNYKEARLSTNNAITLSKTIHTLFHKTYGYGDNTKEQFEEFKERYNKGEFN